MALTPGLNFHTGNSLFYGTVLLAQNALVKCLFEERVSVLNHTDGDNMNVDNIRKISVIMVLNVLFIIPAYSSSLLFACVKSLPCNDPFLSPSSLIRVD